MPDTQTFRWMIEGTLRNLTPFRIGSGEVVPHPLGGDIEVGAVAVAVAVTPAGEAEVRPYIPGSSLKGVLRSWAVQQYGSDNPLVLSVFGRGSQEGDSGCGGAGEFWDALCVSQATTSDEPYWNSSRGTCIASSVAMDRRLGCGADELLFFQEYVPTGTQFNVVISGKRMTQDEAGFLLAGLEAFGTGLDAPALGARTGDGWGRFGFSQPQVRRLSDAEASAWFSSDSTTLPMAAAPTVHPDSLPRPARRIAASTDIELKLELRFEGPFLVNDPSHCKPEGSSDSDHTPLRLGGNIPFLPASSFRGAFRSQAEKIARTLNINVPSLKNPYGDAELPDVKNIKEVEKLDPICLLFGTPGWKAPLDVSDFTGVQSSRLLRQEFIAVDRFTGGGAEHLKFNADFFYRPVLHGSVRLRLDRLQRGARSAEALRLLGLAMRDLMEGDISFGFGAAKGYGACTVRILNPQPLPAWVLPFDEPDLSQLPLTQDGAGTGPAAFPASGGAFLNPYHFIPLEKPADAPETDKALKEGRINRCRHDKYVPGTLSGRIICRLTAETPFFVGSERTREASAELPGAVDAYVLPEGDQKWPAIPASSLRGLISSVAEAASKSSLRVLHDPKVWSYRKEANQALRDLGFVVERSVQGAIGFYLLPLGETLRDGQEDGIFRIGDRTSIRTDEFILSHSNWHEGKPYRPEPYRGEEGVWRVLGCTRAGLKDVSKSAKKKELFVTFPQILDWPLRGEWEPADSKLLPVSVEAVEDFHLMADERLEGERELELPYHPIGTPRNGNPAEFGSKFRLKPGDFVFFRKDNGQVVELALSQIWRGRVPGTPHDFFATTSPELLPYGEKRRKAAKTQNRPVKLTPAELIFGFVELRDSAESKRRQKRPPEEEAILAYAGRVRFSAGILEKVQGEVPDAVQLPEVTLQVLSSPKPPCPALYFRGKVPNPQSIAKKSLNPANHDPQGRKVYLHHAVPAHMDLNQPPWKSKLPESGEDSLNLQKVSIRPVKRGRSFVFHLDFDNLSREELALLLYALRPSETFRHKLGMGKPLGLGTIRIDPQYLRLVGRQSRYAWQGTQPDRYFETFDIRQAAARNKIEEKLGVEKWKHPVLEVLGNPANSRKPVHYPQVKLQEDGSARFEEEHYKWFVANDKGSSKRPPPHPRLTYPAKREAMPPVTEQGIPTLDRFDFYDD